MMTTFSRSQTCASLPNSCLKMLMVGGPQTSCVIRMSVSTQMLSPGCTAGRLVCLASIFSVRVIGGMVCGSFVLGWIVLVYARPSRNRSGSSWRIRLNPRAEEIHRAFHALMPVHLRLPAEQFAGPADVRLAHPGVVLRQRLEDD